jgi:serine/threonine protein kinase
MATVDLTPNSSIVDGKYVLRNKLGEGGMASVWAAIPDNTEALPPEVVLKVLLPEIQKDPNKQKFFVEEAKLSTQLNHPLIVRVFRVERWRQMDILVMERVWGQGLDHLIQQVYQDKQDTVPWPIALRITAMIAEALHYANTAIDRHGQALNVIHRDIKPGNVLFTADGRIKVIDFGIAKASTSELKTQTGIVKGTIAYMSPEQLKGEPLDIRSDLFSLGVLLFELCTGKRPFFGENFTSLMFNILTKPAFDPHAFRTDLPEPVRTLLLDLLDKDPDNRPTTGLDLQQRIEVILRKAPKEGSLKALKEYFAQQYPQLLTERSETAKQLSETDPDANHVESRAVPGGTLPLHSLSEQKKHMIPTGEMLKRSSSMLQSQMGSPVPQTEYLDKVSPEFHPTEVHQHNTEDALPSQPPPRSSSSLLLVLGSLLAFALAGGGTAAYFLTRPPTNKPTTHTQPTPRDTQSHPSRPAAVRQPSLRKTTPTPTPVADAGPTQPRPTKPTQTRSKAAPRRRKTIRPTRRIRPIRRSRRIRRKPIRPAVRIHRKPVIPVIQEGSASIRIRPACTLFFDGKAQGNAGQYTIRAKAGQHTIRCVSALYKFTFIKRITLSPNQVTNVRYTLRKGRLRIVSIPYSRAFLKLPGSAPRALGETPTLTTLHEGTYQLVLFKGNAPSKRITRTITIRPGRTTKIKQRWR